MGGSGGGGIFRCGNCDKCGDLIGKVVDTVKSWFSKGSSSSGSSISKEESYDAENARLEQTVIIQQELTKFRTKCEKECDALERDALKDSRNYIDNLIEFIKNNNSKPYSGQNLNINIERLEKQNRETEDIIRGYIKKKIQKRVSLDDDECLEILKMDKGKDKKDAMTNFLNCILKDAMDGLSKEIEKALKKQLENIKDQINARIESYTERANEKMESFKEIEKIKDSDEHELEERIANLEYKHSLCNFGISLLYGEVQ